MSQITKFSPVYRRGRAAEAFRLSGFPIEEDSEDFEFLAQRCELLSLSRKRSVTLGSGIGFILILLQGKVRVVRNVSDKVIGLGYHRVGDVLGLRALTEGGGFEDVVAVEDADLLRLPTDAVMELARKRPELGLFLLSVSASRRFALEQRLEGLLTRPVEARVADLILSLSDVHGVPHPAGIAIDLRITHHDIAAYVGATRETVTVVLASLRKQGAIQLDKRQIVLCDRQRLEQVA